MKFLIIFLITLRCFAQSSPPLVGTIIKPSENFYAAGIIGFPTTSPKPITWVALAYQVNAAQQLYSYTESDYTPVFQNHKLTVQSSVRTGFATKLKTFGPVGIYGIADAGTSVVQSNVGAAYAGGGFALVPLSKTKQIFLLLGDSVLKSTVGGNNNLVRIGIVWK